MGQYTLERIQKIPTSIEKVWEFMSTSRNLRVITPGNMDFVLTTPDLPEKIFQGQLISYTVRPLFGVKVKWVTEIKQVTELVSFIDIQKSGPFALWNHLHEFHQIEGGVQMRDFVTYRPPLSFIGTLANSLILRKKLDDLFVYRRKKLEEIFGIFPGSKYSSYA